MHTEGIWALRANETFTSFYSGGKDCRVYQTEIRNPDSSVLICEENAAILRIEHDAESKTLWVATTRSDVNRWVSVGTEDLFWNHGDISNNIVCDNR